MKISTSKPTLSFIVPTLNEQAVLERTLRCLQGLTQYEYEIIVSDGGSIDATLAMAYTYAHKVIENKTRARQTIAEGRNLGAAAAQGEYYVFLDADVVIVNINRFFVEAVSYFAAQDNLAGLTVCVKTLPETRTVGDIFFHALVNNIYYLYNNLFGKGASSGEFQMIRAEVFKQVGGYNEQYVAGEDNDLFVRLSQQHKTRLEKTLSVYHTSRRAHKIGWIKLIMLWIGNMVSIKMRNRSFSKEWTVIR